VTIADNLDRALHGYSVTPGKPERDHLIKCLRDLIKFEIERQPLQLLTIAGNRVEGPLAPGILKIVNDAIADYHAQTAKVAVTRQLTLDEHTNGQKVLEQLRDNLRTGKGYSCEPEEVTLGPGDKYTIEGVEGEFVVPGKPFDEYDRAPSPVSTQTGITLCAPSPVSTQTGITLCAPSNFLEEFNKLVIAQQQSAVKELEAKKAPPPSSCQHDLTKPVSTRHVISHTDHKIITKCHACGEFRSYRNDVQEVD
jgi:hypothetical protein